MIAALEKTREYLENGSRADYLGGNQPQIGRVPGSACDLFTSFGLVSPVVLDDLSAFHYKLDSLKFGDVFQRIAGNGDQIRIFTFLD
jgi:hypothetical protein